MTAQPEHVALTSAERQRVSAVHALASTGAPGILQLLEMLVDPSWAVRREVVAALGALGVPAVAPLCELLRTKRDHEARIAAAVDALVASSTDVLEALAALAKNDDPAIAADAAQVLGRRGNATAVPLLSSLVRHTDDNVSVAAIEALGRIGGPRAVETLIVAVQSGNFFRTFPAIDVLGRGGDPRAIAPLAALVEQSMYTTEAARALGKTGETAAVLPLARLLSNATESVVRVAAVSLAELFERHRARFGNDEAPAAALRDVQGAATAVPRLSRALANASDDETVAIARLLGVLGGDASAATLRSLLDRGGRSAEAAAASLKQLGRNADAPIREALLEGNSERRRVVLPVVTRAGAADEIVACFADDDGTVRALACDALARVGAATHVATLFPRLADANPRVVQSAIGAIQALGSDKSEQLLIEAARDPSAVVRRAALRILSYFGKSSSLPLFTNALDDSDPRVREGGLAGLASLEGEPRAIEALLAAADSVGDRATMRAPAMRALGNTATTDPRVGARLLRALEEPDAWVRYYACQALGKRGDVGAVAAISTRVEDAAGQVRVAAVEALSHFDDDTSLRALLHASESADADLQRAALIGLGLGKRAEALPRLMQAAGSHDPATRLVAIAALGEVDSAASRQALVDAARDADVDVRAAAMGFLAASPHRESTAALIELLQVPSERERVGGFLATPSAGRAAALFDALDAADEDVAVVLTSALTRLHSSESEAALVRAMSLSSTAARKSAASSLASLRTNAARAALHHAAQHDSDPEVRRVCSVLASQ